MKNLSDFFVELGGSIEHGIPLSDQDQKQYDEILMAINNYSRLVEDVKDLSNMVVEERTEKERIKKRLSELIDNLNDSLHDKFVSDDIVGELIRIREGDK